MILKRKTTGQCDLSLKGGEYNVGVGYYFFDNRIDSSSIWIWWHRRSIGRHCQVPVCAVLGDVRDLFFPWTERKRGAVISIAPRSGAIEFTIVFVSAVSHASEGVGTNSGRDRSTVDGSRKPTT